MAVNFINVPIVEHGGYKWGALARFSHDHEITCEATIKCVDEKYSFKGGHRVRVYKFKKQVYWKIPQKFMDLDIEDVPPRRVQGRDR